MKTIDILISWVAMLSFSWGLWAAAIGQILMGEREWSIMAPFGLGLLIMITMFMFSIGIKKDVVLEIQEDKVEIQ